jgi:hypothetical protein
MKYANVIIIFFAIAASTGLHAQAIGPQFDFSLNQSLASPDETLPAEEKDKITVSARATFLSRFIWRGLELGDYPQFQPDVTVSYRKFFVGTWASHGLSPSAFDQSIPAYKEVIPYAGLGIDLGERDALTLIVLNHYNPNFGRVGDWAGNGRGSNTLEFRSILNVGKFDFLGSFNFLNDEKNSPYLEVGYTATLPNDYKMRFLASCTPMESPFHGTDSFAITQVGVITSKDIKITESFNLPVRIDLIVNPELDKFYTAFGFAIVF